MKFFKQINKDKNFQERGFTLIETFVAVTILIISITGPMTLVMKGLSAAKSTKGQITAMYLAQDGIEYVRNIRDENILTGNNWLMGLGDCVGHETYCMVNTPNYRDVSRCNDDCEPLKFNAESKLYGYSSNFDWKETVFTRSVNINEISPDKEVLVTVIMRWEEGVNSRSFIIQEHLLNWQ